MTWREYLGIFGAAGLGCGLAIVIFLLVVR